MKYKLGEIYKLSRRRQWREKDLRLYEIMAVNFQNWRKSSIIDLGNSTDPEEK